MRLRLSSLCQTEPFPNRKFVTVTGTHPQSLITWPYSCWSSFFGVILWISLCYISGEEDSFHHTDAQGFLKTKPLQRVMPSDHGPQIVCLTPFPQAHIHTHVCVYHVGRRWHNWCTLCVMHEASLLYEPRYCHWYNVWALLHVPHVCSLTEDDWTNHSAAKYKWW